MKKFMSVLTIAACVFAVASGAQAASLTVDPTGASLVSVDYRFLVSALDADRTIPGAKMGTDANSVAYAVDFPLPAGSLIRFKLTGALWPAAQVFLNRTVGGATNLGSVTPGAATDTITFSVNAAVLAGDTLVVATATSPGTQFPPIILQQSLATGYTVSIEVPEVIHGFTGQNVGLLNVGATGLYAVADGVNMTTAAGGNDTIDVGNLRLTFTGAGTVSDAALALDANGTANDVENAIAVNGATDVWSLTLAGDFTGVLNVDVPGAVGTPFAITPADLAAGEKILTGAGNAPNWGGGITVALNLSDGVAPNPAQVPLNTRTFTYAFTFTDGETASGVRTINPAGTELVKWVTNGAQFFVTDLRNTRRTALLITNTSANDAVVTVDVYCDTGEAYPNVALGAIEGTTTKLFNGIEAAVLAQYPAFAATRYSGLVTVTVPGANVKVEAYQVTGSGTKHHVPIQ